MDVRSLKYFLAVAETGSFSRAAEEVHVSQPALSRQIQQLEREIGTTLFERHGRGVHATEAGLLLRDLARAIVSQVASAKEQVAARALEPSGACGLGIPPSLRAMITMPVVERVRSVHPKVYLRISEGMTMWVRELLGRGEIDVGLISTIEPAGDLTIRPLVTEHLFLVAPIDRGLRLTHPVPITEFVGLPLIVTPPMNSLRRLLDATLTRRGLASTPVLEANMHPLMIGLIARGVGCTVLPYSAIQEDVAERRVSAAPVRDLRISWLIATARGRPLSLATRTLIAVIQSEVRARVSGGDWLTARLHS
jgi:LysR family nitrogen assimilation transcriptional regulator